MSDSRNPPECVDVLKLLDHPLSAREISGILRCSLKQTMARIHSCWRSIIPVTGDYSGFKYARRPIHGAQVRMPKEVGAYDDSGISKRSPKAVAG